MKPLLIAALILTPLAAEAKGKKSKPAPVVVQPVAPAPVAPAPSFMEQQIARALANTRPVGVTTYGAMAAAVAAGQNGGDPVAAAQAASQGF